MKLNNAAAQIFCPDGAETTAALQRTTHLAIGAHQDDIPIMAYDGILRCFDHKGRWFLAVTVTDGGGSPRSGRYAQYTDDEMKAIRAVEENKAAVIGDYSAAIQLAYPSSVAKDGSSSEIVEELAQIIRTAAPDVVYTHNLADKHDTHVAVALRTIAAIKTLPGDARPAAVYGCEVWRDLDWLTDEDKVLFNVTAHANLSAALLGVYDSQIAGGKRYDLATAGRRLAHATFFESHEVDDAKALTFGMDLTPLTVESGDDTAALVAAHIDRMEREVTDRITRLS